PVVYLYGASGGSVVGDAYDGPDNDAYISHYAIASDGTYYAQVRYYSGSLGSYQLRVEQSRGIDLESDQQYANDSIGGADPLTLRGEGGGSSLYLDGQDDSVYVGDPSSLDLSGSLTFEAWVFPANAGSDEPVMAKEGPGGNQAYWFGVYQGQFGLLLNDGSNGWALDARHSGSVSNLQWQHIASTWDGTTWKNYLNGALVGEGTWTGQLIDSPAPLTLGSNSDFNSTRFAGMFDEVRIWNTARSQSEIAEAMSRRLGGAEPGLVGYWSFNEAEGQDAWDSSPSGNDGLLGGSSLPETSDPRWQLYGAPLLGEATQRHGSVGGTIMEGESGNVDEDFFALGMVNDGETILARVILPASSTLVPVIEIRNANNEVVSVNPNPIDAIARVVVRESGPIYPGPYYAMVVGFDGQGHFGQYVLDVTIGEVPQFADLSVSEMALPASAQSGETVQLAWTVGNFGTAATDSSAWYDRVVLSADDEYGNADDFHLVSVQHSGVLAATLPPQTYAVQANVQLPQCISGDYWVFVETDATDLVFEFQLEDNNVLRSSTQISIAQTPLADLETSNVATEAVGVAGEPLPITWTVRNEGTGTTGDGTPGGVVESWIDHIVFSRNAVYGDGDDVAVADVPRSGSLGPGGFYDGQWLGLLPPSLSGEYHVFVAADAGNDVEECENTHPNVAMGAATVLVAPTTFADLKVTSLATESTASIGQEILIQWTVTNTNDAWGPTPTGQWYDRVVLSRDDVYGGADDVELGRVLHDGVLGVGLDYAASLSVAVPQGLDGAYYVLVRTDAFDAVEEFIYEGNNDGGQPLLVLTPNLDVTDLGAPGAAAVGELIDVTWTATNVGSAAADASWVDRLYLSADPALDAGDKPLAERNSADVIPLAVNTPYGRALQVTIPADVGPAGTYYLILAADADGQLHESSENDNTEYRAIDISGPDLSVELTPPASILVRPGDPIDFAGAASNIGNTDAGAFHYRIILSSDRTIGDADDVALVSDQQVSGGLPLAGSPLAISGTVAVPGSAPAGTFYLAVAIDSADEVAELDEGNNVWISDTRLATVSHDFRGPSVTSFAPIGLVNYNVSVLQVRFNEPILAGSFTSDDVAVVTPAGPLAPSAFVLTPDPGDARRFEITIPDQSLEGAYTVMIGPGISDLLTNPMAGSYSGSFTVDKTGPSISQTSPAGVVHTTVSRIDFTFSEPIS
ncbi:MAG: hypothetical protein JXB62_17070, partial [Pirellulales bacterium]|nr:hypothetical protein [Pirellulales bacterium]